MKRVAWWVLLTACAGGKPIGVDSIPSAYVYADGRRIGTTPITVDNDSVITVFAPGYTPYTLTPAQLDWSNVHVKLAPIKVQRPTGDQRRCVSDHKGEPTPDIRDKAWQLVLGALSAARAGHCDEVQAAGRELADIDPIVHDEVFACEEAIARCLEVKP